LFGVIKIRQEPKMKAFGIFTLVIWCVGVEPLPGVREKRETKDCSSIVPSFHRSKRYQVFYKGSEYNGKNIKRTPTWQESRKACQDLGGDLAEFKNRQEQNKVLTAIGQLTYPLGAYKENYWIGIEKGRGDAVWISGEKVDFDSDLMFSKWHSLNKKLNWGFYWGVIQLYGIHENGTWTAGYVCEFGSNKPMDEGVEFCFDKKLWPTSKRSPNDKIQNDDNEDNSNNEDNNNNDYEDNSNNEDNNNNDYEDNKTQ